ncbi:pyridoxal-phosphate dependent enzyme [Litorilinea aerophila]|uniref:Pyridoxal-phosphate dependent enzyme n=1 Tax=Litorilinea aerophila TaxID=1204385 RepID=A0A540VD90_9CHLR|nr:pyridoxal-phosphate dependent enzyme [Litorilinea aerophila]MCC9077425.1 pyridoxal-phosphate dependent enzyme [Litorilinea aerophila]
MNVAIVPGPTYSEMQNPLLLPPALRAAANQARQDELNPLNLFNINWKQTGDAVDRIVLPRELTGVRANIIVLRGRSFPSGSMKVGPAYATLAEEEALNGLRPGQKTVIGPSTGNFGIGTAYVSQLKGYRAVVVMPDNMSKERYERIRKYGGDLDLTPGTESDVILTLERTHSEYVSKPDRYVVLAQFELLPNYRFHRHVTGDAVVKAARDLGNGRVAAFVSAPGSAGTLAAGDYVKSLWPDSKVVALEPRECSTLYDGGQGQHRIEGIGDKMVTLIHNVFNTDLLMLVHDEDTVRGMEVIQSGTRVLVERLGVPEEAARGLVDQFGPSGICNIIGAIKTARYLDLGPQENVVTIATDGYDRYPSVQEALYARNGGKPDDDQLELWAKAAFLGASLGEIVDLNRPGQHARLQEMKEALWTRFGYEPDYIRRMASQEFWDEEYQKIREIDPLIAQVRGALPAVDR